VLANDDDWSTTMYGVSCSSPALQPYYLSNMVNAQQELLHAPTHLTDKLLTDGLERCMLLQHLTGHVEGEGVTVNNATQEPQPAWQQLLGIICTHPAKQHTVTKMGRVTEGAQSGQSQHKC
jgi:hypothetical protein